MCASSIAAARDIPLRAAAPTEVEMTESPVAANAATLPARSYRAAVANVVLASIVSALHVGKATIALPSLQHEFGGSLASLSGIMSVFPFVGVFSGIAAGLLVRRWGDRLLLMAGLVILGVAIGLSLLREPMGRR